MTEETDSEAEMPRQSFSFQHPPHYEESHEGLGVAQLITKEELLANLDDPAAILVNHHYNKGTAFTKEERQALKLTGLLPSAVDDITTQVRRCCAQLARFTLPMSKHIYLTSLRERNETLFYKLLVDHMEDVMPFVYTPTIGQACQEYGLQFRQAEGMYISWEDRGSIRDILNNWRPNVSNRVAIIVVTDGSRILGLGDLGACGMGIPIGKLALYVAAAGFHPAMTLPVLLDVGTNNDDLLKDEFYLGQRHRRVATDEFYSLVDEFLTAVYNKWPGVLVQFEDISNDHCFTLLETYRNKYMCFNDDIQGTGVVIAAGFLNALKITRTPPRDCRVVFVGSGAAGIGVADQMVQALSQRFNLHEDDCHSMFYMVDSKGLITTHRGDPLNPSKHRYARSDISEQYTDLLDIVRFVKPTALIGLSGQCNVFSEDVLKAMATFCERPIIFPLSNPTAHAECTYEAAFNATEGRVIFASGSPFPCIEKNGKTFEPSQGNNLYAFPGLGFGAWLSKATRVTDGMIREATVALADTVTDDDLFRRGLLYPPLSHIRETSAIIAARVMETAFREGVSQLDTQPQDYLAFVKKNRYTPRYLEIRP